MGTQLKIIITGMKVMEEMVEAALLENGEVQKVASLRVVLECQR